MAHNSNIPRPLSVKPQFQLMGTATALGIALLVALPILAVLSSLAGGFDDIQSHIWSTRGPLYLQNSLILCLEVGILATFFGTISAILISLFDLPLQRILNIALILPFAVPTYIAAYAYGGLIPQSYAQYFRSTEGAAIILAATTYPYIYLAVKSSISSRTASVFEASRSLGATPLTTITKILIPMSRAAIAGSLALVLMETIADFGVADYFGVPTLSVGIFRTWYGMGSLQAASQLAAGLFIIALFLIILENISRQGKSSESAQGGRRHTKIKLSPIAVVTAVGFCLIPVFTGFLIPVALLVTNADWSYLTSSHQTLGTSLSNTIFVALITAFIVSIIAIILGYIKRKGNSSLTKIAIRISTFGYALPGAVVAIGVLIAGSSIKGSPLWLTSGIFALIFAYIVRFLTVGYNSVESSLVQINVRLDEAAKNLGASGTRIITKIHIPQIQNAILAGALIVMIDVAKELPATLLLRSFNFETIATQTYRLASDERIAEAAPMAILLIAISFIAVVLFVKTNKQH